MTYRRDVNTWPGVITACVRFLGSAAGSAAGVSDGRLRQLANPCRNDSDVVETLFRLDAACGLAGGGTPIFDLWRTRLQQAGVIERPGARLALAARAAVTAMRTAAAALEAALSPAPALAALRVAGG